MIKHDLHTLLASLSKIFGVIAIAIAVLFLLASLTMALCYIAPSKKLNGVGAGLAKYLFDPIMGFLFETFFPGVFHRFIFLFTTKLYYKRIEKQIHTKYSNKVLSLEREVQLEQVKALRIVDDRNEWRKACHEKETEVEDNYWKGVKYGYDLCDKRKDPQELPKQSDGKLDRAQDFALKQIAQGESVQNYSCAMLESKGYIEAVGTDGSKYKLTDKGIKYLSDKSEQGRRLERALKQVRELI